MKRFWVEDTGATAVIVAVVLVVLLGFTALAVDLGYMFSERRQLQTAADAAALAGCRVLADGGSNADVQAEVDEYAAANAVAPGDALYVEDTDIGVDYVQVTVAKDSPLFFGRIFGSSSSMIRANSRAEVAYLVGMRGLVPWGLPIIKTATKVTVTINGTEIALNDQGSGVWKKTFSAPGTASTTGYQMDVTVYNSQIAYPDGTSNGYPDGVPEYMVDAARVFVPPAGCPIIDVVLDDYVVTAGQDSVQLSVYSPGANKVTAVLNKKTVNLTLMNATTGLWQGSLLVPSSDDLVTSYPITVTSDKYSVSSAATLVVRRSTYPVLDVSGSDYVVGPGSAVTVTVRLNDYVYGNPYTLRVDSDGTDVGNFCCLDLSSVRHFPNWHDLEYPDLSGGGANAYRDYLTGGFPEAIHIGDTIYTQTGNMTGPNKQALQDRFAGDNRTFADWVAAGKPASSRVVCLPVVERMERTTGTSPVRVVSFAAFYVEPSSDIKNNTVTGVFLEYVAPSDAISEDPPDGLYVQTVRLTAPE